MHIVQLLLPVYARNGNEIPVSRLLEVTAELTRQFGGATAYVQSPAVGLWKPRGEKIEQDTIVLIEALVQHFDRGWWTAYRAQLEERFEQEELLARTWKVDTF